MFSEARSASGLSVSARAKMDKHQTRGVDALELMLEDCRLCVRTDRRDEGCICFQLVQARPSEIDYEAIAAGRGGGVDDVAADESIDDLTDLRLRDRRIAQAQPILQIDYSTLSRHSAHVILEVMLSISGCLTP